jgi:hypothetical protein
MMFQRLKAMCMAYTEHTSAKADLIAVVRSPCGFPQDAISAITEIPDDRHGPTSPCAPDAVSPEFMMRERAAADAVRRSDRRASTPAGHWVADGFVVAVKVRTGQVPI